MSVAGMRVWVMAEGLLGGSAFAQASFEAANPVAVPVRQVFVLPGVFAAQPYCLPLNSPADAVVPATASHMLFEPPAA